VEVFNVENWKSVVGYEGIYEVSDSGLVRTHKDKTTHSRLHGVRKWKQRILKDKTPNGRDVRVTLWKNGNPKDFLVHRLVAEAFLVKIPGKDCVNHKDGNPKNNHLDNLEWCNHKENQNHAFDNGLASTNQEIILLNKNTKETIYFRSKAKASEYLGKSHGFISNLMMKGKTEYEEYSFFMSVER
jgi:Holliday junction resolvasome RuvABC endonuclease subunit